MLSCGRVKAELFENANVTASIYEVSEHAHGSLGIMQRHFDCLFLLSKFEQRSLNVAASSDGWGSFRKRSSCGRGYLFSDKKRCVFKNIRTRP